METLYLYPADIARLERKCYKTGLRRAAQIRRRLGISGRAVTVREYAEYMQLREEDVQKSMVKK